MKMNFGTVVISAGLCGLFSFILLAVSIATDYWYIIDVDKGTNSSLEYSSSHSGLWRIYEGKMLNTHNLHSVLCQLYCAAAVHIYILPIFVYIQTHFSLYTDICIDIYIRLNTITFVHGHINLTCSDI